MLIDDIVILKNDPTKQIYKIQKITNMKCLISGVYTRIILEVNIDEIQKATNEEIEYCKKKANDYKSKIIQETRSLPKYLTGKILHIDGDKEYLSKCLELYQSLKIYSYGVCIKEENIYKHIEYLINQTSPDIIVITGHDLYNNQGIKDLSNYTNTTHFINAIKKIRTIKSKYDCCVIAGACQSNFEALIASGADFASSPKRINIHTFDPAVIAIKVATTSFNKIVILNEALKYIDQGRSAFGGLETLGKMRLIL